MISGLVRHSIFRVFNLSESPATVQIEADEAYIQVLSPNVAVYVERQRERALAEVKRKEIPTEHYGIEQRADVTCEMGFVNLNVRQSAENEPVIHPALTGDRYALPVVPTVSGLGIRDSITLTRSGDEGDIAYVLIEEVHYVPADAIGI